MVEEVQLTAEEMLARLVIDPSLAVVRNASNTGFMIMPKADIPRVEGQSRFRSLLKVLEDAGYVRAMLSVRLGRWATDPTRVWAVEALHGDTPPGGVNRRIIEHGPSGEGALARVVAKVDR